ncbi:MAG: helix-turn-helix transcriptional regulator [Lepagella sp.]
MPANKNALIRYKTIDNCLRNRYRHWTLQDLVDACSDVLYEMEGIDTGVSVRTIQGDIQIMRSDKLGYNAPIEVYERKYYRYSDPDYSITEMPMSQNDYEVMQEAVDMLRQLEDFEQFGEMSDVVRRLQDNLAIKKNDRKPIIHFDSVPDLKGLKLLNPLYNYIQRRQVLRIEYQSFRARKPRVFILHPYLLKEFRNRWFVFGSERENRHIYNLALDRIVSIEPAEEAYWENPLFDVEHFFDDVIGVTKNITEKPRKIEFWASAEQSKYIITKPLHRTQRQIGHNPDDGSCLFEIEVVINYEMYSIFLSLGSGVRVLQPPAAVEYMKTKTEEMAKLYQQ